MLERVWWKGKPLTLLVGIKAGTTAMVNGMEIPLNTRNKTTTWPSNPTTGCIPQGNQNWKKNTCTPMSIAALFTIARAQEQPRCPLADEWIKKLWYIHTVEYHSAIKANAFESVLMRWMNLEQIIQSEVSQKNKHHILMHIYGIWRWYVWSYVQGSKGDTDVKNRLLDSVGEGESGMIWENSIKTHTLPYIK